MEANGEVGTDIELTAADDHVFDAYMAAPSCAPRGALVVIHDAFGIGSTFDLFAIPTAPMVTSR